MPTSLAIFCRLLAQNPSLPPLLCRLGSNAPKLLLLPCCLTALAQTLPNSFLPPCLTTPAPPLPKLFPSLASPAQASHPQPHTSLRAGTKHLPSWRTWGAVTSTHPASPAQPFLGASSHLCHHWLHPPQQQQQHPAPRPTSRSRCRPAASTQHLAAPTPPSRPHTPTCCPSYARQGTGCCAFGLAAAAAAAAAADNDDAGRGSGIRAVAPCKCTCLLRVLPQQPRSCAPAHGRAVVRRRWRQWRPAVGPGAEGHWCVLVPHARHQHQPLPAPAAAAAAPNVAAAAAAVLSTPGHAPIQALLIHATATAADARAKGTGGRPAAALPAVPSLPAAGAALGQQQQQQQQRGLGSPSGRCARSGAGSRPTAGQRILAGGRGARVRSLFHVWHTHVRTDMHTHMRAHAHTYTQTYTQTERCFKCASLLHQRSHSCTHRSTHKQHTPTTMFRPHASAQTLAQILCACAHLQVMEQQRAEQAARSAAAIALLLSPDSGLHDRLCSPMTQVQICISQQLVGECVCLSCTSRCAYCPATCAGVGWSSICRVWVEVGFGEVKCSVLGMVFIISG